MICSNILKQLQINVPVEGEISINNGFLPSKLTSQKLNESHQLWDDLAQQLPKLFASNNTQKVLENIPCLSAEESDLSSSDLTRAGVVLSSLAHAYWRFGAKNFFPQRITQVSTKLPDSILIPWQELSRRLGRYQPRNPFQNFYDLFLSNYSYKNNLKDADKKPLIENIDILVPSFGSETEKVFYGSFVEMHYHFIPIVKAVCEIEVGVSTDDIERVYNALGEIRNAFEQATKVWARISPRKNAKTFCDPVLWSKTVAILGVPPAGVPQGATSGACSPVLYLMDALLGRSQFDSEFGQFVKNTAKHMVAESTHRFSVGASKINLDGYIKRKRDSIGGKRLNSAYSEMVHAYMGESGWLGRHTAKVFNYLCISTITGRNASVSGHERYFEKQTWLTASEELQQSRKERLPQSVLQHQNQFKQLWSDYLNEIKAEKSKLLCNYSLWDVAKHHDDDSLWLILDGYVYDFTDFVKKHPGGDLLLKAYAGQDITHAFWGQHVHRQKNIFSMLKRYLVGEYKKTDNEDLFNDILLVMYSLIRCKHALDMQYDHKMDLNVALKLYSDENTHMMLWHENLAGVFNLLKVNGWQFIESQLKDCQYFNNMQALSSKYDLRGGVPLETLSELSARSKQIQMWDRDLIEKLIECVFKFHKQPYKIPNAELLKWELFSQLELIMLYKMDFIRRQTVEQDFACVSEYA